MNSGSVWFDLVVYQVSTLYYVKVEVGCGGLWWVVVGGGVCSNFSVHLWSKNRTLTLT